MISNQRAEVNLTFACSCEINKLAALEGHVKQFEVAELFMHEQRHDKAQYVSY